MRRLAPLGLSLLIGLTLGALVVLLAADEPRAAFGAFVEGAFGSGDSLSEVSVKACPLLLTGLAIAIAFRAGIWNIGGEGQILAGATAVAWVGTALVGLPGWALLPLGLLASAVAGGIWAGIAAWLKLRRGVNEVIGTIMLNFIAFWLLSYLVHGPLMEGSGAYPQSEAIAAAARLPRLVAGYRAHAGILIGLVLGAFSYVLLFRTVSGFRMRAVGANPAAARLAGISPGATALLAFASSGALAGLAGGVEVAAVTYRLYERFSPGYGFMGIAVALLGRLHPGGVVLAAILFGVLEAGSNAMQRSAGVSSVLVSVVQAAVIFGLLATEGAAGWRRPLTPSAAAQADPHPLAPSPAAQADPHPLAPSPAARGRGKSGEVETSPSPTRRGKGSRDGEHR